MRTEQLNNFFNLAKLTLEQKNKSCTDQCNSLIQRQTCCCSPGRRCYAEHIKILTLNVRSMCTIAV